MFSEKSNKKIRSKTNLYCEGRKKQKFSGHVIIKKNFSIFYTVFRKKGDFPNLCV